MSDKQHVDLLIIGSGEAGKNLAWAMPVLASASPWSSAS